MRHIRIMLGGLLLAAAAPPPGPIDLPGARLHPESLSIGADGTAYVGSMTGGVLRVPLKTGRAEPWIAPGAYGSGALFGVFADPVNRMLWTCTNDWAARGLTVKGSDAGSVLKGFDLKTGKGRISLPLPGEKPVCNDIAVGRDGTIYVTDTAAPHLLRWRPGTTALEIWTADPALTAGLDGIAVGGDGHVYVNNIRAGTLLRVARRADGSAGPVTTLALSQPLKAPDGMRAIGPATLAIAGGDRIDRVTIDGDRAMVETLADGIGGITGLDVHGGTIWYVQGQLGALFRPDPATPLLPFRLVPLTATTATR